MIATFFIVFLIVVGIALLAVAGRVSARIKRLAGSTVSKSYGYGSSSREVTYDSDSDSFARMILRIGAAAAFLGSVIVLLFSTVFFQGVGEAKVIVNADGTIAGEKLDPGAGFKAPWQDTVDFDLFSQEALYAGAPDSDGPSYSGGTVNGAEVTVPVKGENGGSTQANVDLSVTYSLDADKVTELYTDYRNQERFTKQVIEKTILTTVRQVPSAYTPVEFRGDKRAEASDRMLESLNDRLNPLGVMVDFVNLQDIRFTEQVENALREVEVSNQNVLKQEAELRAAEISAQQKVAQATAEAEANRVLAESLSPEILESKRLDTLRQIGDKGNTIIVPESSTPFVSVPSK